MPVHIFSYKDFLTKQLIICLIFPKLKNVVYTLNMIDTHSNIDCKCTVYALHKRMKFFVIFISKKILRFLYKSIATKDYFLYFIRKIIFLMSFLRLIFQNNSTIIVRMYTLRMINHGSCENIGLDRFKKNSFLLSSGQVIKHGSNVERTDSHHLLFIFIQ